MDKVINVQVRAFASLCQALGKADLTLDLPAGTTVAHLLQHLESLYPALGPHLPRALVAVNHHYSDRERALMPGDEIAIFPPVSGGADDEEHLTFVTLTPDPLDSMALIERASEPGAGAVLTFVGLVRDNNLGRQVHHLEYEAYPEMAEIKLRQVISEARERWPAIRRVAISHRTGRLEIGEIAIFIAVGESHRNDGAFEALHYLIDRIKEIVPVWKKEVWANGETWVEGEYHPQPGE